MQSITTGNMNAMMLLLGSRRICKTSLRQSAVTRRSETLWWPWFKRSPLDTATVLGVRRQPRKLSGDAAFPGPLHETESKAASRFACRRTPQRPESQGWPGRVGESRSFGSSSHLALFLDQLDEGVLHAGIGFVGCGGLLLQVVR